MILKKCGLALTGFLLATQSYAKDLVLSMPECLESAIAIPHQVLVKQHGLSLVKINARHIEVVAKAKQRAHCGGFKDVTAAYSGKKSFALIDKSTSKKQLNRKIASYGIHHESLVHQLIENVEPNNIWDTLTHLTSYNDRYANSETGMTAAHWLQSHFEKMAKDAGRNDVKTYLVDTGWWYNQPSVVTVVGSDLKSDAIVISAHMDTLSYNKPGADDDGSGSSTITEVAKVILNSSQTFNRPIYFIWYAAEEEGLVGSQYVVSDFLDKKIPVKAVLHMDMTGYRYKGSDKMWVLDDNVNSDLTAYLKTLITHYIGVDVGQTRCGYECSDHASWNDEGFVASATAEGKFGDDDPYIHTSDDTMEHVSLEHMTNYTKLALAFIGELASD